MSLRWKIALALAGLTFVASAVVGIVVYRVTKDRLLNEIDRSLADVNPRPGAVRSSSTNSATVGRCVASRRSWCWPTARWPRPRSRAPCRVAISWTPQRRWRARPGVSTYDTVAVNGDD